jgi:outer membrane protein insertion porin family
MLSSGKWAELSSQNRQSARSRLNQLKISGNKKFSRDLIQRWFNAKPGELISEEAVYQRSSQVLERLRERGYYFAKFDSVIVNYNADSTQVDVILSLDEGELLYVSKFVIEGVENKDQKSFPDLETQVGKPFRQEIFQEDVRQIIRFYEERGHPYGRVNIEEMKLGDSNSDGEFGLEIKLNIIPGPEVTIDAIEIQGNEQTKDYVILRELGFNKGDVYNQQKIDKIQPRLMKLGYFKWVNPPELVMQKDSTGKLIIELEEGSSNRIDGVIGYNPPAANSDGFVTGLLDLKFGNLLGTGRHIEAHWERRTQKTQELRFRYLEPWVAGWPLRAGFSFEQLIQDTSYVQRSLGLDFQVLFDENLSLFTRISKRDISPDSLGAVLFGIPPSSSINLAVGLNYDTLDDLLNPRKGVHYQTSFELGKKSIELPTSEAGTSGDSESFEQKRISIDFESYFSIFKWQVFAIRLHGRQITSDEDVIPITDQYRFGGTRTLRGYREEQFRGSRIAWANIEYRYLLGRHSRFFVFLDTGYFSREELVDNVLKKIDETKIGYGVGLRIDTKLGFFGIDYGLGEGDSLSNGKVHVGLMNEF